MITSTALPAARLAGYLTKSEQAAEREDAADEAWLEWSLAADLGVRPTLGSDRMKRGCRWALLLALASACSGRRPVLDDADQVRLDAVVEATSSRSRAAVCLAVDPRVGDAAAGDATAFDQAQDPRGQFLQAVSRMGHVYPESRCSKGSTVVHPGGAERPGVIVTLGAVEIAADRQRAHLRVTTWPGELQGEVRLLRYRKVGQLWSLEGNTLLMQE